jgi:TolA-binding protein
MSATEISKPTRRPPSSSLNVIFWGLIATAATLYLGVAVARPDLLAGMGPSRPEPNEGQRALSEALVELQSLQDKLSKVSEDVSSLRSAATEKASREAEIDSRLSALEAKPSKGIQTGGLPAKQPTTGKPPAPVAPVQAQTPAPTQSASHSVAPAPSAAAASTKASAEAPVKMLNAPVSEGQVVTGSVANPAAGTVDFGPAVVTPATPPIGIQIARGPSVDALRLSWNLLTDRHGTELQNLEPRYMSASDANGEAFELVAGPLKSTAEAQKICRELQAKAVPCKVGAFNGDAL